MEDNLLPFTPPDPTTAAASQAAQTGRAAPAGSSAADGPTPEPNLASHTGRPVSEVMEVVLWTVHAEDSIERVEEILAAQGLGCAPVAGSNGAIVGMIGAPELAHFHTEGKNPKAVQAWEISRIKAFEVSPSDTVEDVAKLMAENKVETMSVTECGRLVGVVSTQCLLQEILKALPPDTEA